MNTMTQQLQTRQEGWRSHLNDRAKSVESCLANIQNANRLAIHTFEEDDEKAFFPRVIRKDLEDNTPILEAPRPVLVKREDAPLISMSMIPSLKAGYSILPFDMNGIGKPLGYLFNLDETQALSPVVVRAMEHVRFTTYNNRDKRMYLFRDTVPANLDYLYRNHKIDADCPCEDDAYPWKHETEVVKAAELALLNNALSEPAHFASALDVLGRMYESKSKSQLSELLVAATTKHVAAIVLPVTNQTPPSLPQSNRDNLADATDRLCAALCGLAHLKEGIDLPVVTYKMGPPNAGHISYLAQGKGELTSVALSAIDRIRNSQIYEYRPENLPTRIEHLETAIKDLLGESVEMALRDRQSNISINGTSGVVALAC